MAFLEHLLCARDSTPASEKKKQICVIGSSRLLTRPERQRPFMDDAEVPRGIQDHQCVRKVPPPVYSAPTCAHQIIRCLKDEN